MNIKFSYIKIFIAFFIFVFCFRLLLPFGSEPDFEHRVSVILDDSGGFYNAIYSFLLDGYNINCDVNYAMISITGNISNFMCGESFLLKLSRTFIQFFFLISFFFTVLTLLRLSIIRVKDNKEVDALLVSFLFPGLIYYSGVIAEEVIALWLSLLSLLFIRKPFFYPIFIILVFFIDVGASIILTFFISSIYSFKLIYNYWGLKVAELFSFIFVTTCLFLGMQLLGLLQDFPIIGNKVASISYAYTYTSYSEVVDKYPIILRPIITFMSAVFMTSDGVKSVLLYPIIGFLFIYIFIQQRKIAYEEGLVEPYLVTIATLTFILCIVFVLPGYTNAKYYIFSLPIFMYSAVNIFGLKKVINFSFICFFIVIIQLFFSRL